MPTNATDDVNIEDDDVTQVSTITDARIEKLRELAIEDDDTRTADLCTEALAPRMVLGTDADAAARRVEVRTQLAAAWTVYTAREPAPPAPAGGPFAPDPTISDGQISNLLRIAEREGDSVLASTCRRALRGSEARYKCQQAWLKRGFALRAATSATATATAGGDQ